MKTRLFSLMTVAVLFLCSVSSGDAITWTTLDYPGALVTGLTGIDGSNIVGGYRGTSTEGALLYNGTTWTVLDLPAGTGVTGVSGSNIVGKYGALPGSFLYNWTDHTTLNFPDIEIESIDGGNIVGEADGHGVIYNLDSQTWTTLDYPGASSTYIYDIDGDNLIGGYYASGAYHNFLYDGTIWMTLDLPGGITGISGSNIATQRGGIYNLITQSWTAPLAFPGANITDVFDIDGNNIIGQYSKYFDGYKKHGFLAIVPEPATIALFALGAFMLRRISRH